MSTELFFSPTLPPRTYPWWGHLFINHFAFLQKEVITEVATILYARNESETLGVWD